MEFSVIIPVFNDPKGLRDTLDSVIKQDYLKSKYEIIVVDNGSTDSTVDVAKLYLNNYPKLIKYIAQSNNLGSYSARNLGISQAKGKFISFIDADMTVKKDWLKKINKIIGNSNIGYLGCRVRVFSKENNLASLYNVLNHFSVKERMEKEHYAPTCCLTVKRDVLKKIGSFDDRLFSGGDHMFGIKAWNSGVKFKYSDKIVMYHPARSSIYALTKKAMRIGLYGRGGVSKLYPEMRNDINQLYLNYKRYLPSKFWHIRHRYKCGYSFKISTIIFLSIFPPIIHYLTLFGYIRSKIISSPLKNNLGSK